MDDDNQCRDMHHRKAAVVETDRSVTRVPVDSAGTSLQVRRFDGTGPDLIMIHGITSSGAEFHGLAPSISDITRPMTIDLRGHGGSDKPGAGYHYQHYADDLSNLIANLELDRPIVLGHSLGGIIALFWAAQNPGVARGLVIEDSPLRSGEDFREAFEGWLALNDMPENALRAYYTDRHPEITEDELDLRTQSMMATRREAITELFTASMARDGVDTLVDLSKISVPVLFLHGEVEHGSMMHPEDVVNLPAMISDITVREIHGGGHSPHRSHKNEWLHHVRKFISGIAD